MQDSFFKKLSNDELRLSFQSSNNSEALENLREKLNAVLGEEMPLAIMIKLMRFEIAERYFALVDKGPNKYTFMCEICGTETTMTDNDLPHLKDEGCVICNSVGNWSFVEKI